MRLQRKYFMRYFTSLLFILFIGCSFCSTQDNTDTIANGIVIDSLLVQKSERTLTIFSKRKKIKTYKIALGQQPIGKKQFEGDGKTPEGLYFIDDKNAASKFHKNLNVSYPNTDDIKFAAANGKSAGDDIKIHGLPNSFNAKSYIITDWTAGCIALNNNEIDELYKHVKLGSPILILP